MTKALVVTVVFLAACGPRYRTTYNYTPPPTETGRTCVMQCEVTRTQCEALEQQRVDLEAQRADIQHQQCQEAATREYDRCRSQGGQMCIQRTCVRPQVQASTRCEEQYNRCYQSCGGTIETVQQCVARCG